MGSNPTHSIERLRVVRKNNGLTLIELLVVIAILVVISAITIPILREGRDKKQPAPTQVTVVDPSAQSIQSVEASQTFICQTLLIDNPVMGGTDPVAVQKMITDWQTQHPKARIVDIAVLPKNEFQASAIIISAYLPN